MIWHYIDYIAHTLSHFALGAVCLVLWSRTKSPGASPAHTLEHAGAGFGHSLTMFYRPQKMSALQGDEPRVLGRLRWKKPRSQTLPRCAVNMFTFRLGRWSGPGGTGWHANKMVNLASRLGLHLWSAQSRSNSVENPTILERAGMFRQ